MDPAFRASLYRRMAGGGSSEAGPSGLGGRGAKRPRTYPSPKSSAAAGKGKPMLESRRMSLRSQMVAKEAASPHASTEPLNDPSVAARREDNGKSPRDDTSSKESASVDEPQDVLNGPSKRPWRFELCRKSSRVANTEKKSDSVVEQRNDMNGSSNGPLELVDAAKTDSSRTSGSVEITSGKSASVERLNDLNGSSNGPVQSGNGQWRLECRKPSRRAKAKEKGASGVETRNDLNVLSNGPVELEDAAKTESNRKSGRIEVAGKENASFVEPRNDLNKPLNGPVELDDAAAKTKLNRKSLSDEVATKDYTSCVELQNDLHGPSNDPEKLEETTKSESNVESCQAQLVTKESTCLEPLSDSQRASIVPVELEDAKKPESNGDSGRGEMASSERASIVESRNNVNGLSKGPAELEEARKTESNGNTCRFEMATEENTRVEHCRDLQGTSNSSMELEEATKPDADRTPESWQGEMVKEHVALVGTRCVPNGRSNGATELEETAETDMTEKSREKKTVVTHSMTSRCDSERPLKGALESEEAANDQLLPEADVDVEALVPAVRLSCRNAEPTASTPEEAYVMEETPSTNTRSKSKISVHGSEKNVSPMEHQHGTIPTSVNSSVTDCVRDVRNSQTGQNSQELEGDVEAMVPVARLHRSNTRASVGISEEVSVTREARQTRSKLRSSEVNSEKPQRRCTSRASASPPITNRQLKNASIYRGRLTTKEAEEDVEEEVLATRLATRRSKATPEDVSSKRRGQRGRAACSQNPVIDRQEKPACTEASLLSLDVELDVEAMVPAVKLRRSNAGPSLGIPEVNARRTSKRTEVELDEHQSTVQDTGVPSKSSSGIEPKVKEATHLDLSLMTADEEVDVEALVPAVRLRRRNADPALDISEDASGNRHKAKTDVRRTSKRNEMDWSENDSTVGRLRNTAMPSTGSVINPRGKEAARTDASMMTPDVELDVEAMVPAVRLRRRNADSSLGIPEKMSSERDAAKTEARRSSMGSETGSDEVSTARRLRNSGDVFANSAIDPRLKGTARTDASSVTPDMELDVEAMVPAVRVRRRNVGPSAGTLEKVPLEREKPDTETSLTSRRREMNSDAHASTMSRRLGKTATSSSIDPVVKEATNAEAIRITLAAELDVEELVPAARLQRGVAVPAEKVLESDEEEEANASRRTRRSVKEVERFTPVTKRQTGTLSDTRTARCAADNGRRGKERRRELELETTCTPPVKRRRGAVEQSSETIIDRRTVVSADSRPVLPENEMNVKETVSSAGRLLASSSSADSPEIAPAVQDAVDASCSSRREEVNLEAATVQVNQGETIVAGKKISSEAEESKSESTRESSQNEVERDEGEVTVSRHEGSTKMDTSENFCDLQGSNKTEPNSKTRRSNEGLKETCASGRQNTMGSVDTSTAKETETDSSRNKRRSEEGMEECSLEKRQLRDTTVPLNESPDAVREFKQRRVPETSLDTREEDVVDAANSLTPVSPGAKEAGAKSSIANDAVEGELSRSVKRKREMEVAEDKRTKRSRCELEVSVSGAETETLRDGSQKTRQGPQNKSDETTASKRLTSMTCVQKSVSDTDASEAVMGGPVEPSGTRIAGEENLSADKRRESGNLLPQVNLGGNELRVSGNVAADRSLGEKNPPRVGDISTRGKTETKKAAERSNRKRGSQRVTLVPVVRRLDDESAALGGAAEDTATLVVKQEPEPVPAAQVPNEDEDDDIVEVARVFSPRRGVIVRGPLCPSGASSAGGSRPGVIVHARQAATASAPVTSPGRTAAPPQDTAAAAGLSAGDARATGEGPSGPVTWKGGASARERSGASGGGRAAEEDAATSKTSPADGEASRAKDARRPEVGKETRGGDGRGNGSGVEDRICGEGYASDSETQSAPESESGPAGGSAPVPAAGAASESETESAWECDPAPAGGSSPVPAAGPASESETQSAWECDPAPAGGSAPVPAAGAASESETESAWECDPAPAGGSAPVPAAGAASESGTGSAAGCKPGTGVGSEAAPAGGSAPVPAAGAASESGTGSAAGCKPGTGVGSEAAPAGGSAPVPAAGASPASGTGSPAGWKPGTRVESEAAPAVSSAPVPAAGAASAAGGKSGTGVRSVRIRAVASSSASREGQATTAEAAAREGQWERLAELLAAGADPDEVGPTGQRALHYAAVAGHEASVRALISCGADIHAQGPDDQEPLHCAAAGGSVRCMSLLLAAGADLDAGDSFGWTALHWAAAAGAGDAATALLRAGASRHMGDRCGRIPHRISVGPARAVLHFSQQVKQQEQQQQEQRASRSTSLVK